jgi:hypothetical protein
MQFPLEAGPGPAEKPAASGGLLVNVRAATALWQGLRLRLGTVTAMPFRREYAVMFGIYRK